MLMFSSYDLLDTLQDEAAETKHPCGQSLQHRIRKADLFLHNLATNFPMSNQVTRKGELETRTGQRIGTAGERKPPTYRQIGG